MSLLAALAWLGPAALGVIVAAALGRGRGGWGWARARRAGGLAALAVAVVWAAIRAFDWLAKGKGPLAWVGAGPLSSDPGPLAGALLRLSLAAGGLFAVALAVTARVRRAPAARPALAPVAAALAALAALLIAGAFAASPLAYAAALPLDFAAVVPVLAAGVALSWLGQDAVEVDHGAGPADPAAAPIAATGPRPPAPAPPDAEPILARAGLLAGAPAFVTAVPAERPAGAGPLDVIWTACGGAGPAPPALATALAPARAGRLIGDLAAPTEAVFATALAAAALLTGGARVLCVDGEPRAARDRLAAALAALGVRWPGPLCAGEGELRDALARHALPAATFLDAGDLAGRVLGAAPPAGPSWLSSLDLIALCGVDQLPPIESTHLAFALRRTALALETRRARPSWIALGRSGAGTLQYLGRATLAPFEALALGSPATAGVRGYQRSLPRAGAAAAAAEIGAARQALQAAGADPALEDAVGDLRVGRAPGYHGACSLALLEARDLAALFRARTGIAHHDGAHVACWWVVDSPLARFLLRDGALAGLEQQDELPCPRPLAGLGNRFLAAAHLEAALHEGRPDVVALRRTFGDAAVDELAAARPLVHAGRRARYEPATRTIEASPILARSDRPWPDPRRDTVTANAVDVRDAHGGALLGKVDRRVAPTRYYPHRVLRAGGALYQAPGEPLAAGAPQLLVAAAPPGATPTEPELALALSPVAWLGPLEQHQLGKVTFARGAATVDLRESVTGAIPRGQATAAVRFPAVTADYRTVALLLAFPAAPSPAALRHAARLAGAILPAHLRVAAEDFAVACYPDGFAELRRPTIAFVDRHLDGAGLVEALDARALHDLLRWTWGVLYRCPCMTGCEACTPVDVLAAGPDKVGALQLLGG